MFLGLTSTVTLFVLVSLFYAPIAPAIPTIPSTASAESTYYVSAGYLCMSGEQFHTLSDDVYGAHTGKGVYNKYIVTLVGYGGYDFFRISATMLKYQPSDKMIIKILEIDDPAGTTVSYYYHVDTPIYKLPSGTYTVLVGYLNVASEPATYRINMG